MENYFVYYPKDKNEQNIIIYSSNNHQTISNIEKQSNLLQEYRTALISNVVTGKIDVRA